MLKSFGHTLRTVVESACLMAGLAVAGAVLDPVAAPAVAFVAGLFGPYAHAAWLATLGASAFASLWLAVHTARRLSRL